MRRLILLFFCFLGMRTDTMVSDVINLDELPPAYTQVHDKLVMRVLRAQADHLLGSTQSISDINSQIATIEEVLRVIITGHSNYFSFALSFIIDDGGIITILPGMKNSIVMKAGDGMVVEYVAETRITKGLVDIGTYCLDDNDFVCVSGFKEGSTTYIKRFTQICTKLDEKILERIAVKENRKKDSEKVALDLLAAADFCVFFKDILLRSKFLNSSKITGIVFNGSSIRAACDSCIGAIGIQQKLGGYFVERRLGECSKQVGFFVALYDELHKSDLLADSKVFSFSTLISYIVPYEDSAIFAEKRGEFELGKIMQYKIGKECFLKLFKEALQNSTLPVFNSSLMYEAPTEVLEAKEVLNSFYREKKLSTFIERLKSYQPSVMPTYSNAQILLDPSKSDIGDIFEQEE